MPTSWFKNVRDTHRLTIFPTKTVTNGPWSAIFTAAISEFNRLSSVLNLGVSFVQASQPPDPTSMNSGANVQFDAANGQVHEVIIRNRSGDVISEFTETFSGSNMHGLTITPKWADDHNVEHQFRAYIYVPLSPTINAGPAGKQQQRPVGDGVKLFIAVHELIHACGLSNADHSAGSAPDLFIGQPQPVAGAQPKDDKLNITLSPITNLPEDPPKPPFFLTKRTADLMRSIWS